MEAEDWRPIPGASGYEASSRGRVRSIDRPVRTKGGVMGWRRGKVLKPRPYSKYGHVNVGVKYDIDERGRNVPVHILICRTFHGEKPEPAYEVRHLNGKAWDNRPENLRWGTRKENVADRKVHGWFRANRAAG